MLSYLKTGGRDEVLSLCNELARQNLFIIIVHTEQTTPFHSFDTPSLLEAIPSVYMLQIHQEIPLAVMTDKQSLIVKEFSTINLQDDQVVIMSVFQTNEPGIVSEVSQLLEDSLLSTDRAGLWTQFAISLLLNHDMAGITGRLIREDTANYDILIRYWLTVSDKTKAQKGIISRAQQLGE